MKWLLFCCLLIDMAIKQKGDILLKTILPTRHLMFHCQDHLWLVCRAALIDSSIWSGIFRYSSWTFFNCTTLANLELNQSYNFMKITFMKFNSIVKFFVKFYSSLPLVTSKVSDRSLLEDNLEVMIPYIKMKQISIMLQHGQNVDIFLIILIVFRIAHLWVPAGSWHFWCF